MSANERYDVIVVGVGAMGAAACWHAARRGLRVLGLERFSIPHALGSSHGDTRMTRMCYFEHPDYVPLLRRALELWPELEASGGRTLLHRTGGLYMGPSDGLCLTGSLRSAREHDLPHERLDRDEIRRRYPQFTVPDDYLALYEPQAGVLRPEAIISTCAAQAMRDGAVIRGHEPMRRFTVGADGVVVETDRGTYAAARMIVCAGAWAGSLLGDLGVPLTVTRQPLGWVQPKDPDAFALGTLPVWAIDHRDDTLHYGFPVMPSRPGFKLAHHAEFDAVDPETVDRLPGPADEATLRPLLREFIPGADGPLLSMAICMYTNTPDGHFIVDRHPAHDEIVIACGFSGHGFKFCPVIGEALVDLATEGATRWPVGFLGLDRFARS